jgi:3-hydroxyacyl-CoA dehydrogenase
MPRHEIERVAVIGPGTIGINWAVLFLARGLVVSESVRKKLPSTWSRRRMALATNVRHDSRVHVTRSCLP